MHIDKYKFQLIRYKRFYSNEENDHMKQMS
jgi:hypothetical protein